MYLKEGTLLKGGDYKIVRHISSGGFGNTYEGHDVNLDKKVAIKEFFVKDFCSRDADTTTVTVSVAAKKPLINHLKKKFVDEARAIAKMEHDNIVKVQTLFEENGTAYYVMDYIDGESVGSLLKRRGSLQEKETVAIILKVASALDYMHKQNRFHLDVKPGNIMLRKDGKVLLIDFGSSKQFAEVDGENTTTLAPCYTPGYAPTEQMNPKPTAFTAATDVYALGATLYKMLTGMTPPSAIDLVNGEEDLSPLPDEISKNVKECVEKAMIPQRNKRMQSVGEFVGMLNTEVGDDKTVVDDDKTKVDNNDDTLIEVGTSTESEADRIRRIAKERLEAEKRKRDAEEKAKAEEEARERKKREEEAAIQAEIERLKEEEKRNVFREEKDAIYFRINGKEYKMVKVEGGTFDMKEKVPSGFLGLSSKEVVQRTTLSTYYIGETQVTQALWKAVMGKNPSRFKGDNLPVECVSWDDCQTFISNLNSLTGKRFRLPTEAEWEFAARGGNKSNHTQYSGSNNLDEVAWCERNSGGKTHPVATKRPNELGIYDMSGNVWEWCNDWYGDYSNTAQNNPTGPNSGTFRVNRGGSWFDYARHCRVSFRYYYTPVHRNFLLGLRLVLRPSVQ